MALYAAYRQLAAERATAAVLHHVAHQRSAGGFADDAPVQALAAGGQALDHGFGAMVGRAFLVTGDEEGDGALVLRMLGDETLHGHQHGGQAALHVRRATAAEHALLVDQGIEGLVLPGLQRAGGHHVGVAGEAEDGALAAADRPEVLHVLDAHALDAETGGGQPAHHQVLAAFVDRGDRGTTDKVAGEFEGGGKGRHEKLRKAARKRTG
ncbi:hypothetical protein D3C78_420620 [compost metagenome]